MTLKHQQSLLQALLCTPAQLVFHWILPIPSRMLFLAIPKASRRFFWPSQAGKWITSTADLETMLSYYNYFQAYLLLTPPIFCSFTLPFKLCFNCSCGACSKVTTQRWHTCGQCSRTTSRGGRTFTISSVWLSASMN